MSWIDDVARKAVPPYVVNDSKTPSGRAHVGALRGVLIHDVIYRHLVRLESATTYSFGCDDYDALDELPHGLEEFYRPYLGVPLCNVPAPPGSAATDIADHYISEFFALFVELDVAAETYRMRDLYRSGRMDGVIDTILRGRETVRDIYRRVNNSQKPEGWHPFQVVCPSCGKIGSTIVLDYDGDKVRYECREALVTWAVGCGSTGWVSPFGGGGKLPWKLEWAARWKVLGVTIEGAGKDHTTRGGSRDVADAVSREVLDYPPPLNQPYEFFLVGGSKMSSSRGVGASAAGIAALLPPQVLRFLLIRTPARKALNFTPDLESITRLYADYDRMLDGVEADPQLDWALEQHYLSRVAGSAAESARVGRTLAWDTIVSLVQLPHVDVWAQAEARFDPALTPDERTQLGLRVDSARAWLEQFAGPEDRIRLTDGDEALAGLDNTQRAYLGIAGAILVDVEWTPDGVQAGLFDAARATPLAQASAFGAVYRLFLGRDSGPKAGSLLAFLDRADVLARLGGVDHSRRQLLDDTAQAPDAVRSDLERRRAKLDHVTVVADDPGIAELTVVTTQGRRETVRAALAAGPAFDEFVASVREVVPVRG